ncbi:molecular chaperone HtpG [Robbsia andropogonis]|uniref:ATP-binding protein n=1 Tax=Robbsia andropogonis TaxID=28092 RepID=UPI003D19825D
MNSSERIPFKVDISRVIEVLARQIYQSPLALLRENTQNSFDAILLRKAREPHFEPQIEIAIEPSSITVRDNGVGMTREQLRNNYWQAGSSSKNTAEARAAGVVGTFGIGAMANFGIAETLEVETEAMDSSERIVCLAQRSTLSASEDCINFETIPALGEYGTRVTATLLPGNSINVDQAVSYILEFVKFLQVKVSVNGVVRSGASYDELVAPLPIAWEYQVVAGDIGRGFFGNVHITGSANGEVRAQVQDLKVGDKPLAGRLVVRQGIGSLRTFRSGFGLANTSVHSSYALGGIADFLFLEPTAGREALSTESMRILQELVSTIDDLISIQLSQRQEADSSTSFMNWVIQHNRYDLCGQLKIQCAPNEPVFAHVIRETPEREWIGYQGSDTSIVAHASEDRPLLVLSRSNPRRQCEHGFLTQLCEVQWLTDSPKVHVPLDKNQWSYALQGFAFRLGYILSTDYFVQADVAYGSISHALPILAEPDDGRLKIWLDPEGATVKLILSLYEKEYVAFESMTKDFARTVVFPRIADHVPSSTRQGAEAFLRSVQRTRETFEYESSDLDSLQSIWADYADGRISIADAAQRSASVTAKAVQVIESSNTTTVRSVVPDVVNNAEALQQAGDAGNIQEELCGVARPSIQRLEISTESKLLTIPENEPTLNGYRCFLAVSDRVRDDRGDFFLQPHKTSVVWGGQRVLFVFEHHSGEFGLYYDVQSQELVAEVSGGGSFVTSTLVLKNGIFIPVPPEISAAFIPKTNERKRLSVKCDLLFTG